MGNKITTQKCNFEDIQKNLDNFKTNNALLINTLKQKEQDCLIPYTIEILNEEKIINNYLSKNINIDIFIYGKNTNEEAIYEKYNQLRGLGFINVFIYTGGLFEWLCLQDIYGDDIFPTTKKELDLLKYKPISYMKNKLLLNS